MGDLSAVTVADVHPVKIIDQVSGPAAAAINAGVLVAIDANGFFVAADADSSPVKVCRGVALTTSTQANEIIDVMRKGLADLGDVFADAAFSAPIYPSGTAGVLSDSVVGSQPTIGYVATGWGYTTADKLLRVDL